MPWLTGWPHRKRIVIDPAHVDADLVDFPLALVLDADQDLGRLARTDGADLRLTAADGVTPLPYEREAYASDGASASGVLHVRAPLLSSSSATVLYLYFGRSDAPDGEDAPGVWSNGFDAVWHLGPGLGDSAGGYHLVNQSTADAAGRLARGRSIDGGWAHGLYAPDASLDPPEDGLTLSLWARRDGATGNIRQALVSKYDGWSASEWRWSWFVDDSDGRVTFRSYSHTFDTGWFLPLGSWMHLALVQDASAATLYSDGEPVATGPPVAFDAGADAEVAIGVLSETNGHSSFLGALDEVRIERVARSAAWIAAACANQTDPYGFAAIGPRETPAARRGAYFQRMRTD